MGRTLCLVIAVRLLGECGWRGGEDGRRRVKLLEFGDYHDIADLAGALFLDAASPADNQRQSSPQGGRTERRWTLVAQQADGQGCLALTMHCASSDRIWPWRFLLVSLQFRAAYGAKPLKSRRLAGRMNP